MSTAHHPDTTFPGFPGWGLWRSGTLRWWAFRLGATPLTIDQMRAGARLILNADTLAELGEAIRAETVRHPPAPAPTGPEPR